MGPRKLKTAREDRAKAALYQKKAGGHHKAMFQAYESGVRSLSQNHMDVCELVRHQGRKAPLLKGLFQRRI